MAKIKNYKFAIFILAGLVLLIYIFGNLFYYVRPQYYEAGTIMVIESSGEKKAIRTLTQDELEEIQKIYSRVFYYKSPYLNTYQGTEVEYLIELEREGFDDTDVIILNENQTSNSRLIDKTRVNLSRVNCSIFLNEDQMESLINIIK